MSGGRFNYMDSTLKNEIFGWTDRPTNVFEDREISELLGLIADINPTEIASHIAEGNLTKWCESWRQAATVAAENLK